MNYNHFLLFGGGGGGGKYTSLLKQLLNEVLALNPPLIVNNKFDNATKQAVKQFETKYGILPADDDLDEATWIKLGEVIPKTRLDQIIKQSNYDSKLIKLFGLTPSNSVIQKYDYPPFEKGDLKKVEKGLEGAYDLLKDAGVSGDQVLNGKGVPSIKTLLDGVIVNGVNANTFDGRESTLLISFSLSGQTATRSIRQFFVEYKANVGALVTNAGGKKVMFIGHFYFDDTSNGSAQRRSFIIMHESVHLIGNKRDIDFGTPQTVGSHNLSQLLIDKMFPVLNVLSDKYRGVL